MNIKKLLIWLAVGLGVYFLLRKKTKLTAAESKSAYDLAYNNVINNPQSYILVAAQEAFNEIQKSKGVENPPEAYRAYDYIINNPHQAIINAAQKAGAAAVAAAESVLALNNQYP
jgi:hypothetical protein